MAFRMTNCFRHTSEWRSTNRKLTAVDLKWILWSILMMAHIVCSFPQKNEETERWSLVKKNINFAHQSSQLHAHDSHLQSLCETERTTRYFHQLHTSVSSNVFFHPSQYPEIKCKSLTNPAFDRERTLSDSNNAGVCTRLYYSYLDSDGQTRTAIHAGLGCVQRFHVVPYWIVTETDTYHSEGASTYLTRHLQYNFTSTIVPYGCECLPLTTT